MNYKTLLALDSIANFLTQHERIIAIKRSLKEELELTPRMKRGFELIEAYSWQAPKTKIGQDRITRFYDEDTEIWRALNEYKHPIINELVKLK